MKQNNLNIIFLLGIPGSGKSTWKREFLKKNPKYVAVSRDDFRFMLRDQPTLEPKGEEMITELVKYSIVSAINKKYNVIIDETNCNRKRLVPFVEYCQKLADVSFQIFDIPVDVAIERDLKRERTVGEAVIKKMYNNYKNLFDSNFDFSLRKKLPNIVENIKFEYSVKIPNAVVFDVDGTLSHTNNKRGIFDWNKVYLDDIDEKVKETLLIHKRVGYKIIIVTGRDGSCEQMTKDWLDLHEVPYDYFYIRKEGDYRKDTIIKKEIYENNIKDKFNLLGVYDDRDVVTTMWRELGVKCFQVKEGNY